MRIQMSFVLVLGLLTAAFSFVGCSTYSKRDCQNMDWFQAGQKFAMNGKTLQDSQEHYAKECSAQHEISVDQEKLKLGYESGLKVFCSESYSYEFAKSGGVYLGTCPKSIEDTMLPGLKNGRIQYLENKVAMLESEKSSLASQLSSVQGELSICRATLK